MKADDIFEPGEFVIQEIWSLVNRSRFLVADVTGKNPNVFYKLGIAHTIGKDAIIISQTEQDILFDIKHLPFIIYEAKEDGPERLRHDLGNVAKQVAPKINYL